jgi:hypothetical protein
LISWRSSRRRRENLLRNAFNEIKSQPSREEPSFGVGAKVSLECVDDNDAPRLEENKFATLENNEEH